MNKKIIIGIGVVTTILLCIGCFAFGQKSVETISLFVEDGMIKYKSNGSNEEIISLEELLTKDSNSSVVNGKEVEFSIQDGYIVWNYVGETKINKLIAIEDLVGKQGTNGVDGKDGVNGKDGTNGVDGKDAVDGKDGTNGIDGKDGKSVYIWVKYLDNAPENSEDTNLKDESSSYMGIYYGENSVAPTDISSYKWYAVKGEKGDKGDKGDAGVAGKDGAITEIAIFQGKINRSDIDRDYFNLCSGGFLFNNANSMTFDYYKNGEPAVYLNKGQYLVTMQGYVELTGTGNTLIFEFHVLNDSNYYEEYTNAEGMHSFSISRLVNAEYNGTCLQLDIQGSGLSNVVYYVSLMKVG